MNDCRNCKYEFLHGDKEPCFSCSDKKSFSAWEAKDEKQEEFQEYLNDCLNCKYRYTEWDNEPCISCSEDSPYSEWKPKDE